MAVTGNWDITVNSPMGAQKSRVTISGEGSALTGSASGAQGTTQLADVKADGNNVSWKLSITTPMPMTLEFSGAVDGDKISGNVKAGAFGSFPYSGNRA